MLKTTSRSRSLKTSLTLLKAKPTSTKHFAMGRVQSHLILSAVNSMQDDEGSSPLASPSSAVSDMTDPSYFASPSNTGYPRKRGGTVSGLMSSVFDYATTTRFGSTLRHPTTPSKYLIRSFFMSITLIFVAEVVLWLLTLHHPAFSTDAMNDTMIKNSNYWSWHLTKLPISVPGVTSNLSAVSLFSHFMIHVERQFHVSPAFPHGDLLPPTPAISWHPFHLSNNTPATVLLKLHFCLHFSVYALIVVGIVTAGNSDLHPFLIQPCIVLALTPLIYRFLTIIYTSLWMRHGVLELMKISETSFAFGCSAIFICLFLAAETLGCLRYDNDGGEDCASTYYGNWMLGYNAFFTNVAYVLLYWLVDADFSITELMKMRIPTQYIISFTLQTLASVLFLVFFSQKEFQAPDATVWVICSTTYLSLWGSSFWIMCWKNVPAIEGIADSRTSCLFSDTAEVEMYAEIDADEHGDLVPVLTREAELCAQVNSPNHQEYVERDYHTTAASDDMMERHRKTTEMQTYEKHESDVLMGESPPELHSSPHALSRQDKSYRVKGEVVIKGEVTLGEDHAATAQSPTADRLDLDEIGKPRASSVASEARSESSVVSRLGLTWLNRTTHLKHIVHAACTSKHMFLLRMALVSLTYVYFALEMSMIRNFGLYKKFMFETAGMLSFSSMAVHYLCMVDFDCIYVKGYWLDTKPLYERGKVKWNRVAQILLSPKLQYYVHNFSAFSWPVAGWFLETDDVYTGATAGFSVFRFFMSIVVYYMIIRRMCAGVRDKFEKEKEKGGGGGGERVKEDMFIEGLGIMGIMAFLCFEVAGCTYSSWTEWHDFGYDQSGGGFPLIISECTDESDESCTDESYTLYEGEYLNHKCSTFMLANSCMGIQIVFMQIMSKLTFANTTAEDAFNFKLTRYQLLAIFVSILPTFAATFLFARREQIDMRDLNPTEKNDQPFSMETEPLMTLAVNVGYNHFSTIWLLVLLVLGYHAKEMHTYTFYKKIQADYKQNAIEEANHWAKKKAEKKGAGFVDGPTEPTRPDSAGPTLLETYGRQASLSSIDSQEKKARVHWKQAISHARVKVQTRAIRAMLENTRTPLCNCSTPQYTKLEQMGEDDKEGNAGKWFHICSNTTEERAAGEELSEAGCTSFSEGGCGFFEWTDPPAAEEGEVLEGDKKKAALAIVGTFARGGVYHNAMKKAHKRLWILKAILMLVSVGFIYLQVSYMQTGLSVRARESAKGFAFIVQPLSNACWLVHFFAVFDQEETFVEYLHLLLHVVPHTIMPIVFRFRTDGNGASIAAYFVMFMEWCVLVWLFRRMRLIMKKQHRSEGEVMKTLERFFKECVSCFLVVIYVFFEASGCVEGAAAAEAAAPEGMTGSDVCIPYFSSARMFATAMSIPLVIYVASFVADLSTYDILIGEINKTLACGFGGTLFVGSCAVIAFAIRTWDYDTERLPVFYEELYVDFWEVCLYLAEIIVVQGVLRDFDTQLHRKNEEMHRQRAHKMREQMAGAIPDKNLETYDKQEVTRRLRQIRQLFSDEDAGEDEDEGWKDDVLQQGRKFTVEAEGGHSKVRTASTDSENAIREEQEAEMLKCGCYGCVYSYYDPNKDIAHPFGVHYRATRGTQISSNWLGLIV